MCLTLEEGSNTPKNCKNTFFMHIKSRDLYKIQTFYLVCVLGGKGGGGVTSYLLWNFSIIIQE